MGLNPDGVAGIFHCHNPGFTIALGLIQPLTEMSKKKVKFTLLQALWP
jgi:hypothetical protein